MFAAVCRIPRTPPKEGARRNLWFPKDEGRRAAIYPAASRRTLRPSKRKGAEEPMGSPILLPEAKE